MEACYSRHRALAFGGGRKSGSGIKEGKISSLDSKDSLSTIIENADYVGEENRTTKNVIKEILKIGNKIKIPENEELNAEYIDDDFSQYSVGLLS